MKSLSYQALESVDFKKETIALSQQQDPSTSLSPWNLGEGVPQVLCGLPQRIPSIFGRFPWASLRGNRDVLHSQNSMVPKGLLSILRQGLSSKKNAAALGKIKFQARSTLFLAEQRVISDHLPTIPSTQV